MFPSKFIGFQQYWQVLLSTLAGDIRKFSTADSTWAHFYNTDKLFSIYRYPKDGTSGISISIPWK